MGKVADLINPSSLAPISLHFSMISSFPGKDP
jgi:hypothetical protein